MTEIKIRETKEELEELSDQLNSDYSQLMGEKFVLEKQLEELQEKMRLKKNAWQLVQKQIATF